MKIGKSAVEYGILKARIENVWKHADKLLRRDLRKHLQNEGSIDNAMGRFLENLRETKDLIAACGLNNLERRPLGRLVSLLVEACASLVLKKQFCLVRSGNLASSVLFTTAYGREILMLFLLDAAEAKGYDKIAYHGGRQPLWTLREKWEDADKRYLLKSKTSVVALIELRRRYFYQTLRRGWGLNEVEAEEPLFLRGLEELRIEQPPATTNARRHVAVLTEPILRVVLESLNANLSQFSDTIAKIRRQVVEVQNHAVEDFGWIHANNSFELRRAYATAKRFRAGGGSGRLTEECNLRGDLTWYGVICQLAGKKEIGTAGMLRDAFAPAWGGDLKNFQKLLNDCAVPWTRLKKGRPLLKKAHWQNGVLSLLKRKVI
ncbi:MAG TPA: hypothetical protein VNX27_10130 [Chthoniobacterales bacterium]|nr:hypothetical protein [Chthoniobacterales bacterium]